LAYKCKKEGVLKALAGQWGGKVDHRVIEALIKYKVEIDD
jgi:hypothetical protein